MRDKLILVEEVDGHQHLMLQSCVKRWQANEWKVRVVDENPTLTLEQLQEYIDHDCENANYHHLVGIAETIATAALRHVDKNVTLSILRDLAECGGFCQGDMQIVTQSLKKLK